MQKYVKTQSLRKYGAESHGSLGGFDMIFFGLGLALFMALVTIAAWAFHEIHSNQISS